MDWLRADHPWVVFARGLDGYCMRVVYGGGLDWDHPLDLLATSMYSLWVLHVDWIDIY